MRIPKQFTLGSQIVKVKIVDMINNNPELDGFAAYADGTIQLRQLPNYAPEYNEWVFFHELIHYILYMCGEHDLRRNEKLVEIMGTFMHQAIRSFEYESK